MAGEAELGRRVEESKLAERPFAGVHPISGRRLLPPFTSTTGLLHHFNISTL